MRQDNTGQQPTDRAGGGSKPIAWEASEYVHRQKGPVWYLIYSATIAAVVILVNLIPGNGGILITLFILVIGITFGIYANRAPRVVRYTIDASGISIGSKKYTYDNFKSFSVVNEGGINSILLLPVARFLPPLFIYYSPEDEAAIVNVLSANLPFEDYNPDLIDRLVRSIKF